VFTGIAPGTYNVTYNNGTCISTAAQVTVNPAPTAPAAPTAAVTVLQHVPILQDRSLLQFRLLLLALLIA
jgi:hypothetical protein